MIFFDIDQTLLDNRYAEEAATAVFLREHQELFGEYSDQLVANWHAITEKHLQRYFDGELTFQGQRRARLREIVMGRVALDDAEVDNLHLAFFEYYEANWHTFDDVLPCLDLLAPHGLGIISNGDSEQQRQKLTHVKITSHFSTVVISGDIGISKPKPGIFEAACTQAGKPLRDCTYVGDNLRSDARGAVGAGMRGVWLNRCGDSSVSDVETIESLSELGALVGGG